MRLSRSLCAAVGEALSGSHASLEALFRSAGAPGDPPPLAHHTKWKDWLFRAGQDSSIDSLAVLGNVLEEFMDIPPPAAAEGYEAYTQKKARIEAALEENGLRYFRFGRVLPQGVSPSAVTISEKLTGIQTSRPNSVHELLDVVVRGLRRAMHPLSHRRKGAVALSFSNETDVQDLLHALLRPWVSDIRPEEFTPSYAGTSTRMDFLLPTYELVIETKIVRDRAHAKKIGDELIIDIEHYKAHPKCKALWCVIYDAESLITNADGLRSDLEGERSTKNGKIDVRVFVL